MSEQWLLRDWGDSLILHPPTPDAVDMLVAGTGLDRDELVCDMPPGFGLATVEKIAINAAMAGAKPEQMPVIIAAVKALSGVGEHGGKSLLMSTSPHALLLVVNGPIAKELGINPRSGLGPGRDNEVNITIGRAFSLCLRNLGSLAELYVSGNDLTGCIPSALQDVAQNDLDQLSLPYCVPAFETDGYAFSVQHDAAVDTVVGAVTATDADGDTVTYAITGGNEEGKFAIDESSGEITVADLLDYDTASSYSLTVEATDGYGTSVSTVAISLIGDCSVGAAVSYSEANPDPVEDCDLLLVARDTLAGDGALNWSVDTPITDWDGITVGGTPSRVLRLSLISRGLTGPSRQPWQD